MRSILILAATFALAGCATASKPVGQASPSAASDTSLPPGDSLPVVTYQLRPYYPKEMADTKARGEVLVDFIIDKDGSVQAAFAAQQTNPLFGDAAVACVKQWKFHPGLKAGVPVRVHMQVPILFTME